MVPHHKNQPFAARTVDLAQEPHTLQVRVHSPAELRLFSDALEAWMRTVGYSHKDIFAVRLTLHEAVINAFWHGNRSDPSKSIFVRYLLSPTEVLLEVEDQGHGFDPNQVPDPLREPILTDLVAAACSSCVAT
jgi:anti-sigma regulatory factor (Ser/Thr protein kinase)